MDCRGAATEYREKGGELAGDPPRQEMTGDKSAEPVGASPSQSWEADAQKRRIVDFVSDYSIETVSVSSTELAALGAYLQPGASVYVVSPPGRSLDDVADATAHIKGMGFRPVPHIAARSIASRDHLAKFLRRVTSEAGIDQVLVIGGSSGKPAGGFHCTLQIFETGLLEEFGIARIGIAGHPEGHPEIAHDDLVTALRQKTAHARKAGADIYIVSQFCFDPNAVVRWESEIRQAVGDIPIHVGIPGPASLTGLVKYARMCDVGESVRFLTRGASTAPKLATWTPDKFLTALAHYKGANPGSNIAKAHFYCFGGAARTARWLASVGEENFSMRRDGQGFAVDGKALLRR